MKTKNSELIGAGLDWAVAVATGDNPVVVDGEIDTDSWWPFEPSTDWKQCGPLIEQHSVDFEWIVNGTLRADIGDTIAFGPGYLIAACRAIVAASLGDEVELPESLR